MKMMIVDDEKGIVDGLHKMIGRYVPECEMIGAAYNGLDGFRLILERQPDIVITDIRMPQADGLEMIRMLKDEACHAQFILLSGYAEFEYARKGMQLGVQFYINKPVEEEELQNCVYKVMEIIRSERAKQQEVYNLKLQVHNRMVESAFRDHMDAGGDNLPRKKDIITEIKEYVSEHYSEPISLADLSARFFINPYYLSQLFKQKTGETYLSYLAQTRINKAKELLIRTDLKVYEICQRVGYSDTQHFARLFEKLTGCKPSEYRKNPLRQ
ncbi:helix-turn-helix domain-containing protein [Paenibacillus sp. P96]|uniref:Helix-turn-helix domain-containing protein n=1 Tax=Paenibacillus zeirhizosphaerae TaxID=2987519 RepID=A0ABT9FTW4_9BACL|nr:helix-turn-helix domain-containing protein [Paenibacillus sp. P96]MDP4098177.1 helix-turn-helix domain-containing protein [Paenibacillus sp. P96]